MAAPPMAEPRVMGYAPVPAPASATAAAQDRYAEEASNKILARARTKEAASEKNSLERVTVTGSSIKREPIHEASDWLVLMDSLLESGKDAEAAHEWARFRRTYPDYAVPEVLERRLKALPVRSDLY